MTNILNIVFAELVLLIIFHKSIYPYISNLNKNFYQNILFLKTRNKELKSLYLEQVSNTYIIGINHSFKLYLISCCLIYVVMFIFLFMNKDTSLGFCILSIVQLILIVSGYIIKNRVIKILNKEKIAYKIKIQELSPNLEQYIENKSMDY